jgi:hypothetical protein
MKSIPDGLLRFVQALQGVATATGESFHDVLGAAQLIEEMRKNERSDARSAELTSRMTEQLREMRERFGGHDDDDGAHITS